jgi:parallel beta-helix repeat protein
MVLVIAFPILGPAIRGSDGPFSRPLSSPIIIDDDADLVLTAVALGWPGDGSLKRPYIIDGLTIDALGKGACIYLGNTSLHVLVRNCSLTGASPVSSYMPGAGLVLWDCTNATIDNCTASGNLFGIYSMASSRSTLSNCTLSNDRNDIILIHSNVFVVEHNDLTGSTEGLMLQSSNGNTIRHNVLSRSSLLSMGMYESKENILTDNLFHNNTGEAYLYLSDSNKVERNSFNDNAMALKVSWSPYNTLNDNLFERNDLAFYMVNSLHNEIGKCTMLGNYDGFHIYYSDYNNLKNCWIDGSDTAVHLEDSQNNLVYGYVITDARAGILVEGDSDRNRMTDCVIAGTQGRTDNGIDVSTSDGWDNLVRHNTVSGCSVGVRSSLAEKTWVDNNIVRDCSKGILFMEPFRSNATENMISDCSNGIECTWPETTIYDTLTIDGNLIRDCTGVGVLADLGPETATDRRKLVISGNRISSGHAGIDVRSSKTDKIEGNHLLQNEIGIGLFGCDDDLVYNNYLNNDINAVLDNTTGTVWNITRTQGTNIVFGPYLGGNFWSDYAGSDLDGDGLGDEFLPHGPGDHHPLVRDTFTPIITDLTAGTPETGEMFDLRISLEDRPVPQDLDVDLDYELTGPDGLVVAGGTDVGQKHWKELTFSKVISVPENAVLLRYRYRATDRGGNSEGIYKELAVKDTIAPNVTLHPAGPAGTGVGLELNLSVTENIMMGWIGVEYSVSEGAEPFGNTTFDLEGVTGTSYHRPVVPIPRGATTVFVSAYGQDLAGNEVEDVSLLLNVTDILPPSISPPDIYVLDAGLRLSFSTVITDNIKVGGANLTVSWSGRGTITAPLTAEGSVWSAIIDVPLDTVRSRWSIMAWDLQGNTAEASGSYDDPVPITVLSDITTGTPMTGRSFRLAFEERSGLSVSDRTIMWWFETGDVNRTTGALNCTIFVPENARTLNYGYRIVDGYGVEASIDGEKDVLDVIPPSITLSAGGPANDRPISIYWSVDDNVAVKESYVLYRFDGSNWDRADGPEQMAVVHVPVRASVMELEGHVRDDTSIENVSFLRLDVLDPIAPIVARFELVYDIRNDTVVLRADFYDNRGPGDAKVNWSKGGMDQGLIDLDDAWNGEVTRELDLDGYRGEVSFMVVLIDRSGNRVEPPPFSVVALEGRHTSGDWTYLYIVIALVIAIVIVLLIALYLWFRQRTSPPAEE